MDILKSVQLESDPVAPGEAEVDTGLAITAIVISILAASTSVYVTYQVAGVGFRVSENFLSDLATLLAALRSIATKGAIVMGEQRTAPIGIESELDVVRNFVASTSGLALNLYAGEVGSAGPNDDPVAGDWRLLPFRFVNLAALKLSSPSDNKNAGRLALDIELTLSNIDKKAIKSARRQIKKLTEVLSSLESSRRENILLAALGDIHADEVFDRPALVKALFLVLKDHNVEDPDVDLFLASMGEGSVDDAKTALDRGANPNATDTEVLERHREFLSIEAPDLWSRYKARVV